MTKSTNTINYGRNDLLKFVEKCCEVAQEDLTRFFDAWGFFVPMNNLLIGDYGNYKLTSTQSMINSTKEKIAQYPKKCGAIEFIEDRIAHYRRADGRNGNRLAIDYKVGETGDVGQFTAFLPDSLNTKADGYIYTKFGKEVTFSHGSGAVGFRFYSMDDSLLTFCNTYKYTLPQEIATREMKIVAVSADGSESEVTAAYNSSKEVQIKTLVKALNAAKQYMKKEDATGKKVGYIHAYALKDLNTYYTAAKAALADSSQVEHTYGEWVKILSDETDKILADSRAYIKINPKNTYKLTNINSITIDEIKESDNIYDLNGRRVESVIYGNIYIVNGAKTKVTK